MLPALAKGLWLYIYSARIPNTLGHRLNVLFDLAWATGITDPFRRHAMARLRLSAAVPMSSAISVSDNNRTGCDDER